MSSTIANPPPSTTTYQPTSLETPTTTGVQQDPTIGGGTVDQSGPVPGSPPPSTMSVLMESLRSLMPDMGGEKLQVKILEVLTKIRDAISETEEAKIQVDQEAKRLALQEKQDKIDKAMEKAAEAEEKREKLSVWDKIKIAFQYVGAIVSFIAGALALATSWLTGPAGVVSGVMLITAGVILLGMAIDATAVAVQTDKTGKTGLGLVGTIHKEVMMDKGMSEEEAYQEGLKADTIGRIVATAVAGALMLGAAIANGVSAFQLGFAVMQAVQGVTGAVTNTVGALTTIASATGDIVVATEKNKASELESDAKDLEGESKIWEALAKFLDDMIDIALTKLKGMHESFDAKLDELTEAVRDTGTTYGRVGLRT